MKIWIIVAIALILLGSVAVLVSVRINGWDLRGLDASKYQTTTYQLDGEFLHISVQSPEADIRFLLAEDGIGRVVCHEDKKVPHAVTVADGKLTVTAVDERAWYDHIHLFSFTSPKITVYLPQAEYKDLRIEGSTGNVNIPSDFSFASIYVKISTGDIFCGASSAGSLTAHVTTGDVQLNGVTAQEITLSSSTGDIALHRVNSASSIQIDVSTGDVALNDVTCQSLSSTGNTGDMELENVVATESIRLERSTGNIELDRCDAAELLIETDTGDVEGSLLSPKIFLTDTSTGNVRVPQSTSGGRCEIRTSTGDIEFSAP